MLGHYGKSWASVITFRHIRYQVDGLCKTFSSDVPTRAKTVYNKQSILSLFDKEQHNTDLSPPEGNLVDLEERFPQPTGSLNNIMAEVNKELQNPLCKLNYSFSSNKLNKTTKEWTCNCTMQWPHVASFQANGKTKQAASRLVSFKILNWLITEGKITATGNPVLYDRNKLKDIRTSYMHIRLEDADVRNIEQLVQRHENLTMSLPDISSTVQTTFDKIKRLDLPKFSETELVRRSQYLLEKLNENLMDERLQKVKHPDLPIYSYRTNILKALNDNQVVLIKGEPGCGKSTQVPQYVLDEFIQQSNGAKCNILISQPRRISATSLAERVAVERGEMIGDTVGYQVRFKKTATSPLGGSMMFCTTGIVLRRLQEDPLLTNYSHVILDEAHERDVGTDMLLLLLKRAVNGNANLKLIVMSATLQSQLIQRYYQGSASLHIPGFTHPVKSFYLEDISNKVNLQSTYESLELTTPRVNSEEVAKVIKWIDRSKPEGAILCFLPGWNEIKMVSNHLQAIGYPGNNSMVLPVHSRLSYDEQGKIFKTFPPGVRKIILATNVAETSITINDVSYVVDTGIHKEERLHTVSNISSLDNQWVSKANVNQRKGRAGRVKPGECFHLYTKSKLESLNPHPIPELLRIPLETNVLELKSFNENETAVDFLSKMIEPPSEEAVNQAVAELISLDILNEEEKLTPLGRRIVKLTAHPKISKALVSAAVFRCMDTMLSIAAALSANVEFFYNTLDERSVVADIKRKFDNTSDHLAIAKLYKAWNRVLRTDEEHDFISEYRVRRENLYLMKRMRGLFIDQVEECKMISGNYEEFPNSNDELIKALFYHAMGNFIMYRPWDIQKGKLKLSKGVLLTENGNKVVTSSDSVNHKEIKNKSPFLACFKQQRSVERRTTVIRDTSLVSPLAIILFSSNDFRMSKFSDETESSSLAIHLGSKSLYKLILSESQAISLVKLRNVISKILNYFYEHEGCVDTEEYRQMSDIRDDLVTTVSSLLENSKTSNS